MTASTGAGAVRPTTLRELVGAGVATDLRGDGSTLVRGVQHDSRAVGPGDLFVAVPGASLDGASFASDAVSRGAAAVLAERELPLPVPQLIAEDARLALARAAAIVYGDPTGELAVIGITGTNGKTTTAWLVEAAVCGVGGTPALMGTVTFRGPGIERPAPFTTPEGDDLARFVREVVGQGATHLVMEVSSHALALRRVDGVHFRVALFTNLTQDHLDFHGDLETYGREKARLFTELSPGAAVINVDDAFGARLAQELTGIDLFTCSIRGDAAARVRVLEQTADRDGVKARIATPAGEARLESPLIGAHNLENLVMAVACGAALGADLEGWIGGIAASAGAPGRLERIPHPSDVAVLVDYAHTPDALERALAALRPITPGRLLVVFGCGGDRDRGKRPLMGAAAGRGADVCVVTSDNPRTEPPEEIVSAVVPGVATAGQNPIEGALRTASRGYVAMVDRCEAIHAAVRAARPGDTVLIAGRGHETHQVIGTERLPFDDRQVAREAIAAEERGA